MTPLREPRPSRRLPPVYLFIVATSLSLASVEASDVSDLLRREAETGSVRLERIPQFSRTPLRAVTIETPKVDASGEVSGRVRLGTERVEALLHRIRPDIRGADSVWVLAVSSTVPSLGGLVPGLEGSVADDFRLSRGALVACTADVRAGHGDLSPAAATFWTKVFGRSRVQLDLGHGLNLVAAAGPARGGPVARALQTLGCKTTELVLQGKVLAGTGLSELYEAKKQKKLREKILETLSLRAFLPALRLRGLPKTFETGQCSLLVTGKPGVGLGFRLGIHQGKERRDFNCDLRIDKAELGSTVTILASSDGAWRNALGIGGLDLDDTRLLLSVDDKQQVSFGLRAQLALGARQLALAGAVRFHSVSGAVTGGLFEGRLDEISSSDLLAFANASARAVNPGAKPVALGGLPEFSLRNVGVKFAPYADADLGISEGYALEGELWSLGREIAFVAGAIDVSGLVPEIRLAGEVDSFAVGPVGLQGAAVDVLIGLQKNQHFRVAGQLDVLALRRAVHLDISRKKLCVDLSERVRGVYSAAYHLSSPSAGKPSWNVRARLENELTRTLEEQVSKRAIAWAEKTERNYAKTQKNLSQAIRKVEKIDGEIEDIRKTIRAKRRKQSAGLEKALAKVRSLDSQIAARRKVVNAKRRKVWEKLDRAKRAAGSAKKAWQRAVKARKKAKFPAVVKKKAEEAKRFTEWQAKNTAQAVARGAYAAITKTPVDADPQIASLLTAKGTANVALQAAKKLVETFPIDTDPRIVALATAREAAKVGLHTAKLAVGVSEKVVQGAAKVTQWVAENNGQLLMVDSGSFDASLAGLERGSKAGLRLGVRFLGKPQQVKLSLALGALRKGRLVEALWKNLREAI